MYNKRVQPDAVLLLHHRDPSEYTGAIARRWRRRRWCVLLVVGNGVGV